MRVGSTGFSASSTVTRGPSPFQRFTSSIVGVFLGILLIPASFIVVFFTEARRELAPLVRKKAVPANPSSGAQGLVKFTAKPEGAPVRNENVDGDLVRYEEVRQRRVLGPQTAREKEKIRRGDRADTIEHKLTHTDYGWGEKGEDRKTMESLSLSSPKANLSNVKWMGLRTLHDGPPVPGLGTSSASGLDPRGAPGGCAT